MPLKETTAAAKELLSELPIKPRKVKRSDIVLLIASFICALFLWIYIATKITTDSKPLRFENLKVKADMTNTTAEQFELQLLPESIEAIENMTVNCTIQGSRAAIGGLRKSDIEVYVDFNSDIADMIGLQTLPLKVRTTNGAQFSKADLSVNYVTVNMDRYVIKRVPVTDAKYPNLTRDDETIIRENEITFSPSEIEVRGPSTQLSAIDHICVNIPNAEELSETYTFTDCTDYSYIKEDGTVLDSSTFDNRTSSRFSVTIPVCYSRKLPVSIEITGVPNGFDVETVYKRLRIVGSKEYTLPGYGDDNLELRIETSNLLNKETLNGLQSYNLESVALSQLIPNEPIDVSVPIDPDFYYPDNITSVKLKLDATDLITETYPISNSEIELQNKNSRYNYERISPDGKTLVTLCGTEEELAKIDPLELKAYVNLISASNGKDPVVTVTLPKNVTGVWVVNPPTLPMVITVAH